MSLPRASALGALTWAAASRGSQHVVFDESSSPFSPPATRLSQRLSNSNRSRGQANNDWFTPSPQLTTRTGRLPPPPPQKQRYSSTASTPQRSSSPGLQHSPSEVTDRHIRRIESLLFFDNEEFDPLRLGDSLSPARDAQRLNPLTSDDESDEFWLLRPSPDTTSSSIAVGTAVPASLPAVSPTSPAPTSTPSEQFLPPTHVVSTQRGLALQPSPPTLTPPLPSAAVRTESRRRGTLYAAGQRRTRAKPHCNNVACPTVPRTAPLGRMSTNANTTAYSLSRLWDDRPIATSHLGLPPKVIR